MKDGHYGSPPRQRFRCVGPDGFHRFVPELPRQDAQTGTCDECDSRVASHHGPATGRKYAFPVREVAAALVAVGSGASYQRAALRARAASGREELTGSWGGNVVAEWVDTWAPVVLDAFAETGWPETLVLDATRYMVRNVRMGTQSLAFTVLGAYGYPRRGRPRLWALAAHHRGTATQWEDFLRTLDTTTAPRLVITDCADEMGNAVRAVWPAGPSPSFPVPFVSRCEHHLRENAREALTADGVSHWGSLRMAALNDAFHSTAGWEAFKKTVRPKHRTATAWVKDNNDLVSTQVGVRQLLPDHHSTAALDQALGTVRDHLDSRSFVLRNQRRTTTMLGLMRLHINGWDNHRRYTTLLRDWLEANHGQPPRQRGNYDIGTSVRVAREDRATPSLRA